MGLLIFYLFIFLLISPTYSYNYMVYKSFLRKYLPITRFLYKNKGTENFVNFPFNAVTTTRPQNLNCDNNINPKLSNASVYTTLDTMNILQSSCVIVRSPTPVQYEFNINQEYNHNLHDVNTEEVLFGNNKEKNNKSRLNKFLGNFNVFII